MTSRIDEIEAWISEAPTHVFIFRDGQLVGNVDDYLDYLLAIAKAAREALPLLKASLRNLQAEYDRTVDGALYAVLTERWQIVQQLEEALEANSAPPDDRK